MNIPVRTPFAIFALAVVAFVLLLSQTACGGAGGATTPAKKPPRWLIYLASDFRLPKPSFGDTVPGLRQIEACGEEKFERLWSFTDSLIEEAAEAGATLELFANTDATTIPLGGTFAFNINNKEIAAAARGTGPSRNRREEAARVMQKLKAAAKEQRGRHEEAIKNATQHTQNVFQAVEAMRTAAPDALRGGTDVVVAFVSDMVHYNTSEQNQFNLKRGQLNMLQERDRATLLAEQRARGDWWINGRTLTPLKSDVTGSLEVRVVLVDRCATGEALPGAEAPNWALIRGDVHDFWRQVLTALGAETRWNYKPKTSALTENR